MKPQPADRPMPHDLAAERAVLGALIVDQRCATSVFDVLNAVDFYLPANAQLFALIRRMVQHAEPVDLVTVCSRVLEQDAEVYGGAGYVASLPEHCVSPSAAPHYAATVRHASQRRMLLSALHRATELVNQGERETIEDLGGAVAEELLGIASSGKRRDTWSALEGVDLLAQQRESIANGMATEKVTRVIPTPYDDLNELLNGGGFHGGDFIVVGGAPSMGKSALALDFCHTVMMCGLRFVYLSIEPRLLEWTERLESLGTGIEHNKLGPKNNHLLNQREWDTLLAWREENAERLARQVFVHRPGLTLAQAKMRVKTAALTGRVDMIVVDHLHQMDHGVTRDITMAQAIGDTCRGLKDLGGEVDAAVVCLAQLNRTGRSDETQRNRAKFHDEVRGQPAWWNRYALPTLHDLKGSGDIEQVADVIMFPVHAARTHLGSQPGFALAAVLDVAKQRNGRIGRIPMVWDGECIAYRGMTKPNEGGA